MLFSGRHGHNHNPPCTHAQLVEKPQGRGHIYGSLPLYYYSYLTQTYQCPEKHIIFTMFWSHNVFIVLLLHNLCSKTKKSRSCAGSPLHPTLSYPFSIHTPHNVFSNKLKWGRTEVREIFSTSDHIKHYIVYSVMVPSSCGIWYQFEFVILSFRGRELVKIRNTLHSYETVKNEKQRNSESRSVSWGSKVKGMADLISCET